MQTIIKQALAGNPAAQCELGKLFENEEGSAHNIEEAVHWFEKAAAGGVPEAMWRLGRVLYQTDSTRSVSLFASAVEAGCEEAWHDLLRAAGDDASRQARYRCGLLLLNGTPSIPRDSDSAAHWLSEAALDGENGALEKLFEQASLNPDGPFLNEIAKLLAESSHFIQPSVHLDAENRLAELFEKIGRDDDAEKWFYSAASHGHRDATQSLNSLLVSKVCSQYRVALSKDMSVDDTERRLGDISDEVVLGSREKVREEFIDALITAGVHEFETAKRIGSDISGEECDILEKLAKIQNADAIQLQGQIDEFAIESGKHATLAMERFLRAEHLSKGKSKGFLYLLKMVDTQAIPMNVRQKCAFLTGECCHARVDGKPLDTQIELVKKARDLFSFAGEYPDAKLRRDNMIAQLDALLHPPMPHDFSEGD